MLGRQRMCWNKILHCQLYGPICYRKQKEHRMLSKSPPKPSVECHSFRFKSTLDCINRFLFIWCFIPLSYLLCSHCNSCPLLLLNIKELIKKTLHLNKIYSYKYIFISSQFFCEGVLGFWGLGV